MSVVESSVEADTLLHDPFHRLATSFGGIPAGQIWADYFLWELVLSANPHLRAIVEIGTWQGGFSRFLNAQAETRSMSFRTFDAVVPDRPPPWFARMDVFAEADKLRSILTRLEPLILLCDGGNKPRELEEFAPGLRPGSLVVAHDWLTEVLPSDVPECLSVVYEDVCEELGSMSRVFSIKEVV